MVLARTNFLTFRILYIWIGESEIKTAGFTSEGYFKVFVGKISAQKDALHKKLVLRKTQNKFEQCIFLLRIFRSENFKKMDFCLYVL
jgi:hypothetical protein